MTTPTTPRPTPTILEAEVAEAIDRLYSGPAGMKASFRDVLDTAADVLHRHGVLFRPVAPETADRLSEAHEDNFGEEPAWTPEGDGMFPIAGARAIIEALTAKVVGALGQIAKINGPEHHHDDANAAGWIVVITNTATGDRHDREYLDGAALKTFAHQRVYGLSRNLAPDARLWTRVELATKYLCGCRSDDLAANRIYTPAELDTLTHPAIREVAGQWEPENVGGGITRPTLRLTDDVFLVYSDDAGALVLMGEDDAEWIANFPITSPEGMAETILLVAGVYCPTARVNDVTLTASILAAALPR